MNTKLSLASSILTATLLAACSGAPDADSLATAPAAGAMEMDEPASDHAKMDQKPVKTASASGKVVAVDVVAGKITLAHGPVAALDWPAMTMSFSATPEHIAAVSIGQEVDFEFSSDGNTITRISPAN